MARLTKAGAVIAWSGARVLPDDAQLPGPLALFARATAPLRKNGAAEAANNEAKLSEALTSLGPSYIKLGQFLATRDDIIGRDLARDLSTLQDRLPPFSQTEAKLTVEEALGAPTDKLFAEFGPPIAAASIAQVHKARVREAHGTLKPVAVKVLRPGIEQRFKRDLDSYFFAARMVERLHPRSRRLRPIAVVDTLAKSVAIEMDLRMEAAAISEMAQNSRNDEGFRVPQVDWTRSARRVLTLEWIDGIPISDHAALRAAGYDLKALGARLMQTFLRHAMRDGFFHADMHPGNLFIDDASRIVAVDFGIMGRLGFKERRFLAEILYGFLTRNYTRVAEVHFEAGYVPSHHSVENFAQAIRAIGEPIHNRTAEEISMARLLTLLLEVTGLFDMRTRPELILLQKTMVVVEGVARSFNPRLDIWRVAEPVVREWIELNLGPVGRIQSAASGAGELARVLSGLPTIAGRAVALLERLEFLTRDGVQLSSETIAAMGRSEGKKSRWRTIALWIIAATFIGILIAVKQL